jgi:hypothetical protein
VAGRQHLPRHLGVPRHAGGLEHRRPVRRDAEPFQPLADHLCRRLGAALAVGILDPQQEFPAVVTGEQVVEEGGPGAADVQQSGRAGGETRANCHGGCM